MAPGKTVTYEWTLPEDHSPTLGQSNCETRFYHSHVNPAKDIDSGLIGPLIVCKKGKRTFFLWYPVVAVQLQVIFLLIIV